MRKTLERLSALEEATTGRLLSLKGLRMMGYMVVAGTVLDAAARKLERMNDEAVRAQIRRQYARQRAETDTPVTPPESDQTLPLQDVAVEATPHQETNTKETEDER